MSVDHDQPSILITGGAGFIGSHLVEHFQGRGREIRVLDDLRSGNLENLAGLEHRFIRGSITDPAVVAEAMDGADYVFHLAALISVPESMEAPLLCQELNVVGFLNVLEAASQAGVRKVVLSSSAAIYGNNPTVPKVETMVPEPMSPYAITKLDGEYYGEMYAREGKVQFAALRYFNVFGPRQNPNSAYAAAVPIFIDRALRDEPITIYGDGGQTRDFVYVKDVAAANAFAAMTPTVSGVYNVGYGEQLTIQDLAERILRETGSTSTIRKTETRPGDVRHSLAKVDKLREAGFEPTGSLESGLAETLAWYGSQSIS